MNKEIDTLEYRFGLLRKDFISFQRNEWWNSDEDFIINFIKQEKELSYNQGFDNGWDAGIDIDFRE
jgi:hypothetical protein